MFDICARRARAAIRACAWRLLQNLLGMACPYYSLEYVGANFSRTPSVTVVVIPSKVQTSKARPSTSREAIHFRPHRASLSRSQRATSQTRTRGCQNISTYPFLRVISCVYAPRVVLWTTYATRQLSMSFLKFAYGTACGQARLTSTWSRTRLCFSSGYPICDFPHSPVLSPGNIYCVTNPHSGQHMVNRCNKPRVYRVNYGPFASCTRPILRQLFSSPIVNVDHILSRVWSSCKIDVKYAQINESNGTRMPSEATEMK